MSVDMFVRKFRTRLAELPPYHEQGAYDERVMHAPIPAMRAAFSASCLYSHNIGYQLPTFDRFRQMYCDALQETPEYSRKFARYFQGTTPNPGLVYRLSVAYESGICEEYLNVCLVEAIEDRLKCGVVLYDPRADWKLKVDSFILCCGKTFVVNSYWGDVSARREIERRRDESELRTKVNTSVSSQWGNVELGTFIRIDVTRDETSSEHLNGFRLFSPSAIDEVLTSVFDASGVPSEGRPTMDLMIASPPAR